MNNRSNSNLGDEIKNIVQNALNNKDFNKLNLDIQNVVKDALAEVRTSIKPQPKNQIIKQNNTVNSNKVYTQVNNRGKLSPRGTKYAVPIGQVSSILLIVFGSIGSFAFGIATFVLMLLGFTIGSLFHTIAIFLLPLFILSTVLLMNGISIRKRLKRFHKYTLCMNDRDYCLINDLASLTGLSKKYIEKDLRKMIKDGMFPEGKIDDKRTTFILTNECYRQYLELKRGMEIHNSDKLEMLKHQTTQGEVKIVKEVVKKNDLNPEIKKAINEGRKFITEIKQANILIPGQEISYKLDRLEVIVGKIFDYVEIHPEKFIEIRKFTEYFLPTTFKLVDAYKKLDTQTVQGGNILSAKKEIEETMDTINLAFENLLDDLFQDMAMDISTDISVLETILAQEGLTDNGMRVKNKTMEDKE